MRKNHRSKKDVGRMRFTWLGAMLLVQSAVAQYPAGTTAADFDGQDPADWISDNSLARYYNSFSRANCSNNESISYNAIAQESRAVFSHHYRNGTRKHYVVENPPAPGTCHAHPGMQLNGWHCLHLFTDGHRHAAVHGNVLASEPSNDVSYFSAWTVRGVHAINWGAGLGGITVRTIASDCNHAWWQYLGL